MKWKISNKKLALRKETLRQLDASDLVMAIGGASGINTCDKTDASNCCCNPNTKGCPV